MILVTGANGFVGRAVVADAVRRGMTVRGAVRRAPHLPIVGAEYALGLDLGPDANWSSAIVGVDCVVHAAARVHVMNDTVSDPIREFRRVNVEGTARLARQAAAAGARRLIFISSIKVNGEKTIEGRPFRATDPPAPVDPYGISKHEAEQELRLIGDKTGLEVVVIRPVLVYGPGVKANFAAMMRWLRRGVPLPFGAINNRRSLVALDNLVDLIRTCETHHAASGRTFLVSDGDDLSTTELLRRMSSALGVAPWLVPVPEFLLQLGARLAGRGDLGRRLFDSLQVDIEPTTAQLGWVPPVSVDEELRATANAVLNRELNR